MDRPYQPRDYSDIPNFQSFQGPMPLVDELSRTFFRDFHQRIETTLTEMFPTQDAFADAIFAGGYLVYYPVEITSEKMSQQFRVGYPDDYYQGEIP